MKRADPDQPAPRKRRKTTFSRGGKKIQPAQETDAERQRRRKARDAERKKVEQKVIAAQVDADIKRVADRLAKKKADEKRKASAAFAAKRKARAVVKRKPPAKKSRAKTKGETAKRQRKRAPGEG